MKLSPSILTLLLILQAFTASSETELKGAPTELAAYLAGLPQIVSITGESEVKIRADKAEISLKVSTESKSLLDALRSNQEVRAKVAASLKEQGIGSDQIQPAKFASTQKHGLFSEKAKSHRVENFLKVSVRDEKEFQAVAGAVDRWAEVQFLGVDMQHSDKESLKARARAQALDKAGERRKLFEEKLGVKLVARRFADAVTDPVSAAQRTSYYGLRYSSGSGSGLDKASSGPTDPRAPSEMPDDTGNPFGELTFTARVTVDYAVETK
jgi:uncharacterized protein YggE